MSKSKLRQYFLTCDYKIQRAAYVQRVLLNKIYEDGHLLFDGADVIEEIIHSYANYNEAEFDISIINKRILEIYTNASLAKLDKEPIALLCHSLYYTREYLTPDEFGNYQLRLEIVLTLGECANKIFGSKDYNADESGYEMVYNLLRIAKM